MLGLDNKKDSILRLVKLGMSFDRAAILSYCSDEDIKLLEVDARFQQQLEIEAFKEEQELLEQFNQAKKVAISKGNTTAIQWKLEKLNPDRWGSKSVVINKKRFLGEEDEDGISLTDIKSEIDYWNNLKNKYEDQR